MPLQWDDSDFSSAQDIELSDEEAWELDPDIVPISRQEGRIELADSTVAVRGLGYRHKELERLNAAMNTNPVLFRERIRLLNEVCLPAGIMDNVCVTNFVTARAYLREGRNQVGGNWPKVRYVISIMDPPSSNPTTHNHWNDLNPKDGKEFPKENLLRIFMVDSKRACAIEFFPEICRFIQQAMQNRKDPEDCILVHCRKGMSRSVTAVMAYLIWSLHYSVDAALDCVLASRMVACPNSGFYQQCTWWAQMNCNLYNFNDGFSKELRMDPVYLKMRQDKKLKTYGRRPDTRALDGIARPNPLGAREHSTT